MFKTACLRMSTRFRLLASAAQQSILFSSMRNPFFRLYYEGYAVLPYNGFIKVRLVRLSL